MHIVKPPIYGFCDGRLPLPSQEAHEDYRKISLRAERFSELAGRVLEQAQDGRTAGIAFNFSTSVLSGLRFAFMYLDPLSAFEKPDIASQELPYAVSPNGGRDAWEQRTLPSGHGLVLNRLTVSANDEDYDIQGHGDLDGGLVMVDFESLEDMQDKVVITPNPFDPLDRD